jgi:hypothetical protein
MFVRNCASTVEQDSVGGWWNSKLRPAHRFEVGRVQGDEPAGGQQSGENALLHTFTLDAQDRILMVAPVQPNPLQEPEQPEPKPDTAKKPFKLLVIIGIVFIVIRLTFCIQVCVTTDENGVETKTNLVKPSPGSQASSTSSHTSSSQFETRAKVKIQPHH